MAATNKKKKRHRVRIPLEFCPKLKEEQSRKQKTLCVSISCFTALQEGPKLSVSFNGREPVNLSLLLGERLPTVGEKKKAIRILAKQSVRRLESWYLVLGGLPGRKLTYRVHSVHTPDEMKARH